jgi:hypothetical protein
MSDAMRLDLLEELLRRRDADQAARSNLASGAPDKRSDAFARVQQIDAENAAWLRNVLTLWRWPGRSLVGDEGSHAAWLLAQHADCDPELQQRGLELLARAVADGEASPGDLAFLTDRVLLASGQTQIYGTQLGMRDGQLVACRLRDPDTVDERRESVGLEKLEIYLGRARDLLGIPSPARIICPNCLAEIEIWPPELGGRSVVECASCHTVHTIRPLIRKTRVAGIS